MEKYRVRLKTGRVVGPFLSEQILEMKDKGHVVGSEDGQLFPTGDWVRIDSFPFWRKDVRLDAAAEGTFIIDLGSKKEELKKETTPEEVKQVETEPKLESSAPKPLPQNFREFDYRQSQLDEDSGKSAADIKLDIPTKSVHLEDQKTTIRPKTSSAADENKTVITPEAKKWRAQLEEEKRLREEQERKKAEAEELERKSSEKAVEKIDYNNEATQAISLVEIKKTLKAESNRSESELQQIEDDEEIKRAEEEQRILSEEVAEERNRLEVETKETGKAKRKKMILLSVILLVVLAALFPEEDPPKKKSSQIIPVDPEITFPVPFDVKDTFKSDKFMTEAKEGLSKGTYAGKISAAKSLRQAYENDTARKDALTRLIRIYGELLPHSSEFERDGNTIFKLLQANRILQDVEPDVALGASLFYRALGKQEASLDVLDRFVKSGSTKPTRELFAAYLIVLSDKNIENKADEVATSLLKTEKRGIETNLALLHYYRYKNYPEEAYKVIKTTLAEHPTSVPVLIASGEFQLEEVNMKGLAETVAKISDLEAEKSRLYYGKLLEFQGFLLAFQNKTAEATLKFNEALKFNDSDSLRDRLTNIQGIDSETNDEATKLIKQVKARELIQQAQKASMKFDFETALLKSLEAHGLNSGYIKADLALASIQMKLGMTSEALATLEDLQKRNPKDKAANFALLEAYIQNFKLSDARRMIAIMATSDMKDDWRYSSLNAQMYEKMGDLNQSILWLQKAINQNPIEDQNLFRLAKIFSRAKRFSQAKNNLFKAMELNPVHIEYKLAYAELIYEVDGVDKAIDYLFGLLKQLPDHPSVLGEIAIYYHRAGKNKQFLDTKKDVEALPTKDPRIYRFLIRASILDEKFDEATKYTEEYLKLEPGDLAVMMEMGQTLMKLKRYKEAATWFVRVRNKLPSYPRVGYYKARIEVYLNNLNQALIDVQEDIKMNGEYEEGLNLMGEIYFAKGETIPAENEYKKALRINARSYGALRGLADITFRRGQMDMALDLYKRAISELKGTGDDPTVHRKLGDVYRLMGQGSLAIESYQVYLKLVPDAVDKAEVEQHIRVLE